VCLHRRTRGEPFGVSAREVVDLRDQLTRAVRRRALSPRQAAAHLERELGRRVAARLRRPPPAAPTLVVGADPHPPPHTLDASRGRSGRRRRAAGRMSMSTPRVYVEAWILCLPWLPLRLALVLPFALLFWLLGQPWPRSWPQVRASLRDLAWEVRHALGLPERWLYDDNARERYLGALARDSRRALRGLFEGTVEHLAQDVLPPGVAARVSVLAGVGAGQLALFDLARGRAAGEPVHLLDWPLVHAGARTGSLRFALFAPDASDPGAAAIAAADVIGARLARQDVMLRLRLETVASLTPVEACHAGRAAAAARRAA
jgi:hypothetical protein